MKLETIIGFVLLGVLLVGGFVYGTSSKKTTAFSAETSISPVLLAIEGNATKSILADGEKSAQAVFLSEEKKKSMFSVAPDISSPDGFVNTEGKPVSLAELKGNKIVLLDIWTYSCINCQRTIPVLNKLYEKYADQGLEIIGLHTPEFAFERVQKNVEEAVKRFDIKYPVVLDNDFSTWNAYGNRYWPRKYLVDIDGYIVYDHIGEGGYEETEHAVQQALLERGNRLGVKIDTSMWGVGMTGENVVTPAQVGSPEIYFGASRNEYLENGKSGTIGNQMFTAPSEVKLNKLYLGGSWYVNSEYAENKGDGTITFKYKAKNVYMVASGEVGTKIEIFRDGVFLKSLSIQGERLYPLIEGALSSEHTILIKVPAGESLKAFTFTFG